MTEKSQGLGRGLGALLGATPTVSPSRSSGTLPVSMMRPGAFQPRVEIHREALEELATSIKANGVIQPIVVRRLPEGSAGGVRYEIVAGERRWQAAKLAGLADIPTIVRELSDREAVAVALIENIQREQLTAAEEARALKRLVEEYSLTHEAVADFVGRSRAAVSNLIRILDLPEAVIGLIDAKAISMGHARALLGLTDDDEKLRVARLVAARGMSVRQTEEWVRKRQRGETGSSSVKRPELAVVSEVLRSERVQMQLHQKTQGRARIVIEVRDAESRDAVLAAIREVAGDL